MSVFLFPKRLCNELNGLLAKFWWGNQNNGKGMHWGSWDRLGQQKKDGGMGFRNTECFNLALLAKQGWRILSNPKSLVSQIYKQKYFKGSSFLEAKLGSSPSYIWRSIWKASELIKEGLRWRVGNGEKIKIWKDKWLNVPTSFRVQSPVMRLHKEARVEELIVKEGKIWNENLIRGIFVESEVEQILSIPLSKMGSEDKMVWGPSNKGIFSVRSAYFMEMDRRRRSKGETSAEFSSDKRWGRFGN
ncbi:uncharacterized mitochondrial protein AtMg00310-like [Carya illinoinensis]|uniref:uncharacterized mitochondrial protein AtMg00310-like n=1 Tax=Carya illinoinensis TaxID=32201 RepID=UPI001C7276D5|nr:uncharacterized mitochondrial protein AtMg00310-like [Carya illinoinensis]